MLKFGRNYILTVQASDGQLITITDPLTLEFNINTDINASVSTCQLSVYNLGNQKRLRIFQDRYVTDKKRTLELKAGYDGVYSTVFKGNVNMAQSGKNQGSPDIITEIVGFDGGFSIINSYTSVTLGKGISQKEIVRRLASDLIDTQIGAIGEFPGVSFRGRSFMGNTADLLRRETNNHFFINNGRVYCIGNNEVIPGSIRVISSKTGLLGTPKKQGNIVTAEVLFEPRLQIGQVIELQSIVNPNFDGIYKINGLNHRGTISGAVGGPCITQVTMFSGSFTLIT